MGWGGGWEIAGGGGEACSAAQVWVRRQGGGWGAGRVTLTFAVDLLPEV